MTQISVVVPIYNALDDLKVLLASLLKNFNFELGEICLINDFSNHETSKYLKEFVEKYDKFKLLNNEQNLGFIKTCNKGMKQASGDIIVLLNSDTEIPSNFCERIIKCFDSDSKIGIASPISSYSGTYYISMPQNYNVEKMNIVLNKKHKCLYPVIPAAEGFCFCIRKEVIEQQGYLDEIYGKGYHEEVDFAYRSITNGWKNVLIDNLYVYHKRHASFGIKQREKLIEQNNEVFYARWKGLRENYEKENNLVNPVIKIEQEMFPFRTFFFKKKIKKGCSYNFFEELFSIKNSKDKKHKIIFFLGICITLKRNKIKKKGVLYTCITGNYDNLIVHSYQNKKLDYICFTDNEKLLKQKKIGFWKIKTLEYNELDNTKNARWHKTHPHVLFKDYDFSIWVDANINVLTNKLFENIENKKEDILIPIHNTRNCVYEEVDACRKLNKDDSSNLDIALQFLKINNMPKNYGLLETNIIYRKHNKTIVKKLMEEWWAIIEKYSKRDQLSLTFVLWKNSISPFVISMDNARIDSKNYCLVKHIHKQDKSKLQLSFFEKIFSIKNKGIHKIITILGVKIKLKNKKLIEKQKTDEIKNILQGIKRGSCKNYESLNHSYNKLNNNYQNLNNNCETIKKNIGAIINSNKEILTAQIFNNLILQKEWIKNKEFIPTKGAATYSFLYILLLILEKIQPKNILEFGLGQTTILTTQYAKYKNPDAILSVIDHDEAWINAMSEQLPTAENIKIIKRDLEQFSLNNTQNDKYYNLQEITSDKKFDFIIIDGPYGFDRLYPRTNILDLIPNNLAEDFVIILDDAERVGEQNTAKLIFEKLDENNIQYYKFYQRATKSQLVITSEKYKFISFY